MLTLRQLEPVGGISPNVAAGVRYQATVVACDTGIESTPTNGRSQQIPSRVQNPHASSQNMLDAGQPTPLIEWMKWLPNDAKKTAPRFPPVTSSVTLKKFQEDGTEVWLYQTRVPFP